MARFDSHLALASLAIVGTAASGAAGAPRQGRPVVPRDDFLLSDTTAAVDRSRSTASRRFTRSAVVHTGLNWRDHVNTVAPKLFQ